MRYFLVAALGGGILASVQMASASNITVTADGSTIGESNIGTGSTIGLRGYYLYDYNNSGGTPVTSGAAAAGGYASTVTTDLGTANQGAGASYTNVSLAYSTSYSSLALNGGTSNHTGVLYNHTTYPNGAPALTNVVTFTLGSSVPSSFVVSVLTDNASGGINNDMAEVGVTTDPGGSSSGSTTAAQTTIGNSTPSSDFYSFLVTGAMPGDTIILSTQPQSQNGATSGTTFYPDLGGVAFDAVTPEPSAFLLVGLAVPAMLFHRKRRAIS